MRKNKVAIIKSAAKAFAQKGFWYHTIGYTTFAEKE